MEIRIYIEGWADSKEDRIRCREGFHKLLEKAGFRGHGRLPGLDLCGSRDTTFRDFQISLINTNRISLLLVDSEDPIAGITDEIDNNFAWRHLKVRDKWTRPLNTHNRQALLMATCMESWIAADRAALNEHYGSPDLQVSALPPLFDLENRHRHDVQDALAHASRASKKSYAKGKRSFEILAKLNPDTLIKHLSQFRRFIKVLKAVLPSK